MCACSGVVLASDAIILLSMQKMESGDGESNGEPSKHLKMMNYYYINYKEFVNVVKYKLDMMRKKIQSEGKTVSYLMLRCSSSVCVYNLIGS